MNLDVFGRVTAAGPRFLSRVIVGDDCWLWRGAHSEDGYGTFQLATASKLGAHRISWALFNGRWPKAWVLHRCGNPGCVRPDHLYEGGPVENSEDARRHGTLAQGESHGSAKLTDDQVEEIRSRYVAGEKPSSLAREFKVSRVQVSNIVQGRQRGGSPLGENKARRYAVVCARCGSEFQRKPGARKPRYCSIQCRADAQNGVQRAGEARRCPVCGVDFYRPPSAKATTCSYACMGRLQSRTGSVRGERNGNAKLTDAQREDIRRRRAAGEKQIDLADEYGVSRDQIARVCRAAPP